MGNGGGEVLEVVICLAGSTNLVISGCSGRESGTSGSLTSWPRRMASSSSMRDVPHSSSMGFKREGLHNVILTEGHQGGHTSLQFSC